MTFIPSKEWNGLSSHTVVAESLESFKKLFLRLMSYVCDLLDLLISD